MGPSRPSSSPYATCLAALLLLSACSSNRRASDPTEPDRFIIGAAPVPARGAPVGSPSTPAPDPSSPRTPAERLAEAHRDAVARAPKPRPAITANDIRRRSPPASREAPERRIHELKRVLAQIDHEDPEFFDVLLRLAETYLDLTAWYELQSERLAPDRHDDHVQQQRRSLLAKAEHARRNAIKVYQVLVTHSASARHVRRGDALFHYGLELGALGRDDEMREATLRLIREFPTHPGVPFAYASFGDYYLQKAQLKEAEKLYTKITAAFPDSPALPYAYNKLGWCYLQQGRAGDADAFARSIDAFTRSIDASTRRDSDLPIASEILDDSRQGLAEAYVHAAEPRAASAFLERSEGTGTADELKATHERLALAYFRAERYSRSKELLQQLQRRYPDDPRACEWQWQIFLDVLVDDDGATILHERTELRARLEHLQAADARSPLTARCRERVRDAERVLLPDQAPPR